MAYKGKDPLRAELEEEDYSHYLKILIQSDHDMSYPDPFHVLLMKSRRKVIEQMGEISCSKIGDPEHDLYVDRLLLHTYAAHMAGLVVSAVCARRMEFEKRWPKRNWQWGMRSWFERNWILYYPDEHVHLFSRYTHFLEELEGREGSRSPIAEPVWQVSVSEEEMEQSGNSDDEKAVNSDEDPSLQIRLVRVCDENILDEFREISQLEMIRKLQFGTFTVKRTSDITWQEWKIMERLGLLHYYFRVNMYIIPYDAIIYFLCRAFVSSEDILLYHTPEGNVVEITWQMVADAYGHPYDKLDSIFVEGCSTHDLVERSPKRMYEMNVTNQRRILDGGETRDCVPELVFERKRYDGTSVSFVTNMEAEVIFCNTRSGRYSYPMVYQMMLALDGFQVNWAHAILYGIRTEVAFLQRVAKRCRSNRSHKEEEDDSLWRMDWGPTLVPILFYHRRLLFPVSQWDTIERSWKAIKDNKGPSYSSLHDMRAVFDVLFSDGYNYDAEVENLRRNVDTSTSSLMDNSRLRKEDYDRDRRVLSVTTTSPRSGRLEDREDIEEVQENEEVEDQIKCEERRFMELEGEQSPNTRRLQMAAERLTVKIRRGSTTSTMAVDGGHGGHGLESSDSEYPAFPVDENVYNTSRDSPQGSDYRGDEGKSSSRKGTNDLNAIEKLDEEYSPPGKSITPQRSLDDNDEKEKFPEDVPDREVCAMKEEMHVDDENSNGAYHDQKPLEPVVSAVNEDGRSSITLESCIHEEFSRRYEEFCSSAVTYLFDSKGKRTLTEEELQQYHEGLLDQLGWTDKVRGKLEHFKSQAENFYENLRQEFPVKAGSSDNSSQCNRNSAASKGGFALEIFRTATQTTIYAVESIIFHLAKEEVGKGNKDV
ncbi:hypothetical protein R1flu_015757 [Riccia fluitans]|uniref:Uncharacterized protein n=1 Tax=Riccia fluitans TaxID=41844 RepID=A0ABD1YKB9_9MARC